MATIVGHAPGMEEIARMATDEIEGWLREYPGYRGLVVLTDEAGERSRVITLWASAEDELRARESRGTMRDGVAATVGMTVVGMDVLDVPLLELV